MRCGYPQIQAFENIQTIVNFEAPPKYNEYKSACQQVEGESGSILNFFDENERKELLPLYKRKMLKAFGKDNILQCLPVLWQELDGLKSRVNDVLRTLTTKYVMQEKVNEVKQQMLSSKRLKDYFADHPKEQDILRQDIAKTQ